MNNKYLICYYIHTLLLKNNVNNPQISVKLNKPVALENKHNKTLQFTVYFPKLGLGFVLLCFVDDLLRGSNLQILCTLDFLAPFLKEMDFTGSSSACVSLPVM